MRTTVSTISNVCVLPAVLLVLAGCSPDRSTQRGQQGPRETSWRVVAEEDLDDTQRRQQAVALQARVELFQMLSMRLAEVLTESGPVSAIAVCKSEAPQMASGVSQSLDVKIGRTSHRLRNSENKPPDWARPLVDQQVSEPQFVVFEDRRLGALLPIQLQAACELCHGPKNEIVPDVRAALVTHYPQDKAVDFREGDLRGWFWVEVPATED
jgi:hypothetical protein